MSGPHFGDSYWHLSRTLFIGPCDLVGTLSAYFDESGTDASSRSAVVAGYVGSDFGWKRFAARWAAALDGERVSILHRTDLENFRGEFTAERGWNPSRRTVFLKRLHYIIKTNTDSAVAATVLKDDFERTMPSWIKELVGGPYGWCAFWCTFAMRGWCQERHHSGLINWVFEAGAEGTREILEMFQALQLTTLRASVQVGTWTFAAKDLKPLQAADLVAYELFKHVENQILDSGRRPRRLSALDLFRRQDERYVTLWDKDRLRIWLAGAERKLPTYEGISLEEMDELKRAVRRH